VTTVTALRQAHFGKLSDHSDHRMLPAKKIAENTLHKKNSTKNTEVVAQRTQREI